MGYGIDLFCLGSYYTTRPTCPGYAAPSPVQTPATNPPPPPDTSGASTSTPPDGSGVSFTQSSYGAMLPIVFGNDLLGGNVIWSSNFVLNQIAGPSGLQYYWTCSFAMALCEGPIDALLRIYVGDLIVLDNVTATNADGTVAPNSKGVVNNVTVDFTTPDSPLKALPDQKRNTRITLFDGSASQIPKSIMSETEGYEFSPGYRGVGFVLFENFVIQDSIPQITIEIASNTVTVLPRQYGSILSLASGGAMGTVERSISAFLAYDPGYDVVFLGTSDADDTVSGVTIFDNNTMLPIHECIFLDPDWQTSISDPSDAKLLANGEKTLLLPATGNLYIFCGGEGGKSRNFVVNPWANKILSRIEGTSTLEHDSDGPGNSAPGNHVSTAYAADKKTMEDMLPLFGFSGAQSIGFLNVTKDGKQTWHDFNNDFIESVLGSQGDASITYTVPDAVSIAHPTFPDGGATAGQHVYVFAGGTDTLAITVRRVSVFPPDTTDLPNYGPDPAATISLGDLSGFGTSPSISLIFNCPSDNTIILCLTNNGGQTNANAAGLWIIKWDPLFGRVVWKTPVDSLMSGGVRHGPDACRPIIVNNLFSWIGILDDDPAIWTIDLSTGIATKGQTLSSQNLPVPNSSCAQFYNGNENAITYLTASTAVQGDLCKVFVGRSTRAQIPLVDIVTKLLARVDWNIADTIVDDIAEIALDGYTVTDVEQIREVFSDLQQVFTFDIVESNGRILYKSRGATPTLSINETQLGATSNDEPWLIETHDYDFANTRKLNLTYRDIDMQYKSNVQSVMLPKYNNVIVDADAPIDVQVNIVMSANDAKRLAEILLYAKITYETAFDGGLPQSGTPFDPSDVVTFNFKPEDSLDAITLRLRTVSIGADKKVTFNATREDPDIYADQVDLFGTLGRYVVPTIPNVQPRVDPLLLSIPFRGDFEGSANDGRGQYPIYMTLLNVRPAALPSQAILVYIDANSTPITIPAFPNYPTWGYTQNALPPWPGYYMTDFKSVLTVQLLSATGAQMETLDDYYAMLNSRTANLALVGDELINFQTVTALGNNMYELSGIGRCLFGTEAGAATHTSSDRFVLLGSADGLLDPSIVKLNVPLDTGPDKAVTIVVPSTNAYQPSVGVNYQSLQFRPFQSGGGKIVLSGSDAILTWQYSARYNGEWSEDGDESTDVVFEDSDGTTLVPTYTIYLTATPATFNAADASTYKRKVEVSNVLTYTYTAAQMTADGFDWTTQELTALVIETNSKTGLDVGETAVIYGGKLSV